MTAPVPSVALVGPGAIGVTFAAAVQVAGVTPVVCARRPTDAPTLSRPDGPDVTLAGPVLTDPAEADGPVDWVLCAVKAHQVAGAAGWLSALSGPRTVVVGLMNGIEHRELLEPLVNGATVLPAVVWAPATVAGDARFELSGPARVTLPADDAGRRFAALLAGGFGEPTLTPDFEDATWRKLLANAVSGLLAVADRPTGIFREDDVRSAAAGLLAEGVAVARAVGVDLPDAVIDEAIGYVAGRPPESTTSILVDRRAGRALEWEARNGVIGRVGRARGVPTPVNDLLTALLRLASEDGGD